MFRMGGLRIRGIHRRREGGSVGFFFTRESNVCFWMVYRYLMISVLVFAFALGETETELLKWNCGVVIILTFARVHIKCKGWHQF